MSSLDRQFLWLGVAAVAVRVAFNLYTNFTFDDAFITFRYAQNLAMGHGFVYNLGERVMGCSSPLYALIISVFQLAKFPPIEAALVVSLLCSAGTAVILLRYAQLLRFTWFAVVPAIAYILWPRSVPIDISGMETALFTFLVTASFYWYRKRLTVYAVGAATLASLTRPEGLLVLFILYALTVKDNPPLWSRHLAVPAALLIPWVLFSQYYFGSVIPHSISAKLALYGNFGSGTVWERLVYVMGWQQSLGWVLTALALVGLRWLRKYQNAGGIETLWLACMILGYSLSQTHLFAWYLTPLYPLYLLLASGAVMQLVHWIGPSPEKQRILRYGVAAVLIVVLGISLIGPAKYYREFQRKQETMHREVGEYLFRNALRTDRVAAEDIGYIGYYSGLRILDRDGLVSPEAVPYNRNGEYYRLIEDFQPRWVVAAVGSATSKFIDQPLFLESYSLVQEFGDGTTAYRIYRRRGTASS